MHLALSAIKLGEMDQAVIIGSYKLGYFIDTVNDANFYRRKYYGSSYAQRNDVRLGCFVTDRLL